MYTQRVEGVLELEANFVSLSNAAGSSSVMQGEAAVVEVMICEDPCRSQFVDDESSASATSSCRHGAELSDLERP